MLLAFCHIFNSYSFQQLRQRHFYAHLDGTSTGFGGTGSFGGIITGSLGFTGFSGITGIGSSLFGIVGISGISGMGCCILHVLKDYSNKIYANEKEIRTLFSFRLSRSTPHKQHPPKKYQSPIQSNHPSQSQKS